jgi:hypothetical protein
MTAFDFVPWSVRAKRRRRRIRNLPYHEALDACQSRADLEFMARDRGYRAGWVNHVLAARRRQQRKDFDR